ncbi:hypothetical protein ABZ942_36905 [Nocardia sp. NPDC046473]|uniref:hypothetical protein n=1 Tax=Nocardia sp. NPDC046473 TaxID=3155733 RepID=UPI0033C58132
MRVAFGHSDEQALAALRRIQQRYSGLTYRSPLRGGQIVLEPVLAADPDMDRIEFWYAIMDATPDGCSSGGLLPDGTVLFGLFDVDVPTFPSLDNFLECDALLAFAGRQVLVSAESTTDLTGHLAMLRERHPTLHRMDRESGLCVEWWSDGQTLIFLTSLEARLTPGFALTGPVPTTVKTWSLGVPRA